MASSKRRNPWTRFRVDLIASSWGALTHLCLAEQETPQPVPVEGSLANESQQQIGQLVRTR
jgi:hypothetical protein